MPLGEKLWEETSKAVGKKIMDVSEKGIQEEVNFVSDIRGFGRLQGMEGKIVGTDEHTGKLREGVISGTASGVLTLGDEMVSYKAVGLGKLVKKSPLGASKLVSLLDFIDPPPNLSWMSDMLVIWEAEVDTENQLIKATAYEWI
jgi:hypothetical protein